MIQYELNSGFVRRRQFSKAVFQQLHPPYEISVALVERLQQRWIQVVGEQGFRQFSQIQLQNACDGMYVYFFQELLRLVGI